MTEAVELVAEIRHNLGTGAARNLRRNGLVPAVVYGAGKDSLSISVSEKEITRLYRKKHFISTVIKLDLDGKKVKVLPKAVDLHPIKDVVRHMDFVFLNDNIQKMEVPIVFEGKEKAIGVKRGGFFNIIKRSITLLCPVNDIPSNITIDVNNLSIGQSIKSSMLPLPNGCELFNKKDFIVASITGRGGKSSDSSEVTSSAEAAPNEAKPKATDAKAKTDKSK